MLQNNFFNKDAVKLAKALLGKVIRVKYKSYWLSAQIIETEAYYLHEKGSHASQGFTEKRKACFMPAGTIYMYYSRGSDSMNISAKGEGDAVLIKSGIPYVDGLSPKKNLKVMQTLNPVPTDGRLRDVEKLCSGQTLLCRALNLKVVDWDQQTFDAQRFYVEDVNYKPKKIIQTTRLGIPEGRDEDLAYRFVDFANALYCTSNPLRKEHVCL